MLSPKILAQCCAFWGVRGPAELIGKSVLKGLLRSFWASVYSGIRGCSSTWQERVGACPNILGKPRVLDLCKTWSEPA